MLICVAEFADGERVRMSTYCRRDKPDYERGKALCRAAWQSRHKTNAEPPPILWIRFEGSDGVVIDDVAPKPKQNRGRKTQTKIDPEKEKPTDESKPPIPAFISRLTFVFAKTLWDTPHEWCKVTEENNDDYMALFNAVQELGVKGAWNGKKYKYYYPGDGFRYWTMTPTFPGFKNWGRIINRTRIEDPEGYYAERMKHAKGWMETRGRREAKKAKEAKAKAKEAGKAES